MMWWSWQWEAGAPQPDAAAVTGEHAEGLLAGWPAGLADVQGSAWWSRTISVASPSQAIMCGRWPTRCGRHGRQVAGVQGPLGEG